MKYVIKEYIDYNEIEITNIYQSVGWINYVNNPKMLKEAYNNSLKILGAYDDDKLIGIIRVVGDGVSIVYIQDIIVLPEYHRRGVGIALLTQILDDYKNAYQKVLLTDNTKKTIQFYKSIGFDMDTDIECRAFMKMY